MAYIPGPSDKNSVKKIKEIKSLEKETAAENSSEFQEIPKRRKKNKADLPAADFVPAEKKERIKRDKKVIRSGNPVLVTLLLISLFFSFFSFYKIFDMSESTRKRLDLMSEKYNGNYSELKKQIEENKKLLEPDGIIDKFITAANLVEDYSVGIDQIIDTAQSASFKNVGFMKIFISGSEPVWVSIKGSDGKTYFAENVNPGLSKQSFYYYKSPSIQIEDIDYSISSNFEITSGNFDRTYLMFFNFGSTKLVKMDKQKIANPAKVYDIWLPK